MTALPSSGTRAAHAAGAPAEPQPACSRRALALAAGIACHGTFALAIAAMLVGLRNGLVSGHGRLTGAAAWAANLALALQFPLAHSLLLTAGGRRGLARLLGRRHGRTLTPTTYAWSAALQILATFTLWSPSGIVWWRPTGAFGLAADLAYAGAWLFLGKALLDGGLGLQTGWIGWTAVWRGRAPSFPPMARTGLFAVCRQPIYLGFALTLWTGALWTPDHLLLASVWSAYCVLGPRLKERRYERFYGPEFAEYRRRVPYMLSLRRRSA